MQPEPIFSLTPAKGFSHNKDNTSLYYMYTEHDFSRSLIGSPYSLRTPLTCLWEKKRSMAKSWQLTWLEKDPNEVVKLPLIVRIRLNYYRVAMVSFLNGGVGFFFSVFLLHTTPPLVFCHILPTACQHHFVWTPFCAPLAIWHSFILALRYDWFTCLFS